MLLKVQKNFTSIFFASGIFSAKELKINVTHGALLLNGENPGEFAVVPGSPGDKAGLREKDVVLSVDGDDVTVELGKSTDFD